MTEEIVNELDAALSVWPWDDSKGVDLPMKIATVYRCVTLLSNSVASLPIELLQKRSDKTFQAVNTGRLPLLLGRQPNELFGSFDFWKQVVVQLLCQGNAYIVWMKNGFSGDYDRFILCTPNSVSFNKHTRIYSVNDTTWGLRGNYKPWEIIHIKGFSMDGFEGLSVLEFARISTQIASAGDKETHDRFRNGGNVRGFFTNSTPTITGVGQYQDKVLKKISENRDLHFRTGGRLSYLPGGVQFKELMMTSADMQFLESRKFTLRELCRFFGVHPSFVFDDTSNNYKSAEMANVAFLSNTLNPLLTQIENELERKLLFRDLDKRIRFDRSGLFACDLESKIKWQTSRIAAGIDTPNEARAAENRSPVDGGDEVLMSANLKSLHSLLNENISNETSKKTEYR